MSEQWEYQIIVRHPHDQSEWQMLNAWGEEGWELVAVRAKNTGGMIGGVEDHFYFKRRRLL